MHAAGANKQPRQRQTGLYSAKCLAAGQKAQLQNSPKLDHSNFDCCIYPGIASK